MQNLADNISVKLKVSIQKAVRSWSARFENLDQEQESTATFCDDDGPLDIGAVYDLLQGFSKENGTPYRPVGTRFLWF